MKIIQILPEFEEGGVERHVLWLSNELAARGHDILAVSSGGKLERQLAPAVIHWKLPVHLKNPVTAAWCAVKIAARARKEGWEMLHAHSRVPAWIAWWGSKLCGKPWVFTAHANYSRNFGLRPVVNAGAVIGVSHYVKNQLQGYLPVDVRVVYNGLPRKYREWHAGNDGEVKRLLFVGRLTVKKGLQVVFQGLGELSEKDWVLDVVGDGPLREDLENMASELGLDGKVRFHGFSEDVENWMQRCDCFLFPSLEEGMGLTLMQAIHMKVPTLASDLAPVRELADRKKGDLVAPGDAREWANRIARFLEHGDGFSAFEVSKIRTVEETAGCIEDVYSGLLKQLE